MIVFSSLLVDGAPRRVLYAIPPRFVQWDGHHVAATVDAGAQLLTPILLPDDCKVKPLGVIRTIVHAPAMFDGTGSLRLNLDSSLLAETVVHELGHYIQRAAKGPFAYATDYLGHLPGAQIDAWRRGGTWHEWHEMERQARAWAQAIMQRRFYVDGVYQMDRETQPIDAVAEIRKLMVQHAGVGASAGGDGTGSDTGDKR